MTHRASILGNSSLSPPHRAENSGSSWRPPNVRLACRMAKKREPVDELLDALVWMRRKAKKHEAVDDLVDALVKMRRKAKVKVAKSKRTTTRKKKPAR